MASNRHSQQYTSDDAILVERGLSNCNGMGEALQYSDGGFANRASDWVEEGQEPFPNERNWKFSMNVAAI